MTSADPRFASSRSLRPHRRALLLAGLGLLGAGVPAFGSSETPERPIVRRSGIAFGTTVSIAVVDDGRPRAEIEAAFDAAFAAIRAVQKAADLFDPGSEISRLNRDGRVVAPSADLVALVDHGVRLATASGGAFDPTVQPIWEAWRDAGGRPETAALVAARARVDHRAVRLSTEEIGFARPGMAMTLNALAQGHAADRVAAVLGARGITDAFVDTGEFGVRGSHPSGRDWRVAVARPHRRDLVVGRISVADARFVATSADDRTYWTPDFSEHHIVEPWSGHSPRSLAEVVVSARSGLVADGLSTALMVTGFGEIGRRLLAEEPAAGALAVAKGGEITIHGAFPAVEPS
ncbi:MAG: FAD:protein FMN transferase [Phyllobacteriaceae bacterium]|nr:FAD:protein FMN transferase [Phyllobacteriaceae bacterium]